MIKKTLSNNFGEDKYILGLQSYASHDPGACIVKFNLKKNSLEFVAEEITKTIIFNNNLKNGHFGYN